MTDQIFEKYCIVCGRMFRTRSGKMMVCTDHFEEYYLKPRRGKKRYDNNRRPRSRDNRFHEG